MAIRARMGRRSFMEDTLKLKTLAYESSTTAHSGGSSLQKRNPIESSTSEFDELRPVVIGDVVISGANVISDVAPQ